MSALISAATAAQTALKQRLAAGWQHIVILERLARGGGATRWFFITSLPALEQAISLFRGGSSVSFYFSTHLHVENDTESSRQEMYDEIVRHGELVLGYPSPVDPEFETTIISGPSELTEFLMLHPAGALTVWGQWPHRENNGTSAITVNLVDADGTLRKHPH